MRVPLPPPFPSPSRPPPVPSPLLREVTSPSPGSLNLPNPHTCPVPIYTVIQLTFLILPIVPSPPPSPLQGCTALQASQTRGRP